VLRVFRSPDYRRFWTASFVSNVGLWIQTIALGWLVYGMTRSASWLGLIGFAGNLPMLVLGLVGGAIADRASRRTIMLGTQAALGVNALVLTGLTASGHVTVWWVIALAMTGGLASALYAPAMQSVLPSLVAPGELLNAISLNSVQFNLARTLGPALAGLLYGVIGPAGCFALNAAGFLVMTLVLARVRIADRPVVAPPSVLRALREGLGYAARHPVIGPSLLLATLMSIFGFAYIILLPALARDALHLDASGLGFLMAAVGVGAVLGGLGLSALGDLPRKGLVATVGAVVFGVVLAGFSVVRSPRGTAALLFTLGIVQTVAIASLNTAIQLTVHDGMRGRVMSMMAVILFGLTTAGGLVVGLVADRIGVPAALAVGGAIIAVGACVLGFTAAPAFFGAGGGPAPALEAARRAAG
jgi:MFS family permease